MRCPCCGAPTRVTGTRQLGTGPGAQNQRWRRCRACDWHGTTYEIHHQPSPRSTPNEQPQSRP
jgi:transcriptional regulator NrdR family protein